MNTVQDTATQMIRNVLVLVLVLVLMLSMVSMNVWMIAHDRCLRRW